MSLLVFSKVKCAHQVTMATAANTPACALMELFVTKLHLPLGFPWQPPWSCFLASTIRGNTFNQKELRKQLIKKSSFQFGAVTTSGWIALVKTSPVSSVVSEKAANPWRSLWPLIPSDWDADWTTRRGYQPLTPPTTMKTFIQEVTESH